MMRYMNEVFQNGAVVEQHPGMSIGVGTDRSTIPTDGSAFATIHYAQREGGSADWIVNGSTYSEPLVQDVESGLWWSEIEVDAVGRSAGDSVEVACNGESLTLEVV